MTVEEHVVFQLCEAMGIEPTKRQLGEMIAILVNFKTGQRLATRYLEQEQSRLRDGLLAISNAGSITTPAACKSVAYDIVMNSIPPEVAVHQLAERSA